MNITVVGRGSVGGGLADRWEQAGHRVTRLSREGGDASDADAVLVAVPSTRSQTRSARSTASRARSPSTRPTPTPAAPGATIRSPTR
jgi:hypothetical protein